MTSKEHLVLLKLHKDVLDKLKSANQCPDKAEARKLLASAAEDLKFLGSNILGGKVDLDDGETVPTGIFLSDMGKLLMLDERSLEYLPKLIDLMHWMVNVYEKQIAELAGDN